MDLPAKLRQTVTILTMAVLSTLSLKGQTYYFDNYNTIDGLESSKIYTICQTIDGFIWLGTDVGLSKFDGSQFENYSIKQGLSNGGVRVLFEDSNNNLWAGHEGGKVTIYNDKQFKKIDGLPIKSNITSICQDSSNVIWVSTIKDGAFRILDLDSVSNSVTYKHYTSKELSDMIFNSYVSPKGELYFITDIGIKKYNKTDSVFERFSPKHLDTYFQFSVLFEDSRNYRWYGTYNGGLYQQNIETEDIKYIDIKNGLASNWITDILEDRNGNIWISHWDQEVRGGLTKITPGGKMKIFDTDNGLHDNKIWKILEDKEHNILVGTTEHGLDIFKGEKLINYSTSDGLGNNQVYAICQDADKNFWYGTNEGITIYDPTNNSFKYINQENQQISNQIRFIKKDQNNNLWIGTEDQGVQLFDFQLNRFVSKPEIYSRLYKQKSIWALDIDKNNQLWIGNLGGILQYDINKDEYIKTYSQIIGVQTIYAASNGILWVGSQGKLSYMHNGEFTNLDFDEIVTPTAIIENLNNQMVVGTEAHGIFVLDNYQIIKHFTINNGLLTNNIRSLNKDDYGNIYAGTTIGLNKIICDMDVIVSYSARDGFTGIETKKHATYKDHNGKLWIGTMGGVTCYNPEFDVENPVIPIAHISNMYVNGELINMTDNLVFPHTKNNFLFQYNSIAITQPSSVDYLIKLEGADKNWEDANQQKSAQYRTLAPGHYSFMVKAINSYGFSSSHPAKIDFIILAPIYKRSWFIVMSVLLLLVAIFIIFKIRERNLVQEKKILAEKVDERTKELSQTNRELAERNKDITDSIHYAKRIQFAILPADTSFKDMFIFFQPKDIVSGDFYWANNHHGKDYLAVVDCTGHGVPGAFMSFIGHTSLNKIIIENGVCHPNEILNQLNIEVTENLHQKNDDTVKDGMDLSLICYDTKTKILEYAGAYNPLWLIRNDELIEIKANRFSIGRSDEEKRFTNHKVKIEPNDIIYLFTDGYADQFGGPKGKKLKISAMRSLLLNNHHLPMEKQHFELYKKLSDWKGDLEQVDDILIAGKRFE